MKVTRLLIALMMTVLFSSTAIAVDVNISGAVNDTYTLNSMDITSDRTIYLNISDGVPPPPGQLSLGLSPTSLPTGTVGIAYSQTVTMTATGGTSPYTYSCSGSGVVGISADNFGSTCTISGTPIDTGTYYVNFIVTDNASANNTVTIFFSVNSDGGGEPPGVITLNNYDSYKGVSIAPGATIYYKFTVPVGTTYIQVNLLSYDYDTNQDAIVSYGLPAPDPNDYPKDIYYTCKDNPDWWCRVSPGSSNETTYIYSFAVGTFYIMVHNTESVKTGKFNIGLAWY